MRFALVRAICRDDYLFLHHRNRDLVFADLGLRGLPALYGDPFYVHLLMPLWHPYPLAVCPYPLSHPQAASLALSGAGIKFLFGPLHPELVLVRGGASTSG